MLLRIAVTACRTRFWLEVVSSMHRNQVSVPAQCYGEFHNMCSKIGDVSAIFKSLEFMRHDGVESTMGTHIAVVRALAQARQLHQALLVLDKVYDAYGGSPSPSATLQSCLRFLLQKCDTRDELHLVVQWIDSHSMDGMPMTQETLHLIVRLCADFGLNDLAVYFFDGAERSGHPLPISMVQRLLNVPQRLSRVVARSSSPHVHV